MKGQGGRWVLLAVTGLGCSAILLAPLLENQALYNLFSSICHQKPERSWFLAGHPLPVCIRCASIYSGFLLALALKARPSVPAFKVALVLSVLELIVAHAWLDFVAARSVSGMMLGISAAGLVERGVNEMLVTRIGLGPQQVAGHLALRGRQ
jgi:uncharacterized membrane protein